MIDPNEFLRPLDFFVAPFVAVFIYLIAVYIRNKYYPKGHPWRPYFIAGLSFKLVGALTIGLIYAYYYKGGDTFNYHFHARVINSALNESFGKWFNLLLAIPEKGAGEYYIYTSQLWWYQRGSSYTVSAIDAFISAPLGSLYLPTALAFAALAYSGLWALFRTFAKIYPSLTRQMAIACLFVPGVAIWGSSIFKDTVSMFSLGWLTYGIINIVALRNYKPIILIITALSFFLAVNVKPYIIIAISPPVLFWAASERLRVIKNLQIKSIVGFLLFALLFGLFGILLSTSNELTNAFTLENITKTSATTRGWIGYVNSIDQGAGYTLGEFEPTLAGMFSKFPQAVNVTLFRPYLWESRKIIVFLNALESLIILLLTIKVITSVGLKKIITTIKNTPAIMFTFAFSILFAFAVGISTYNFGTLSRYKIPCIPFYLISLVLIYYKNKPINRPLWRLIRI